MKKVFLEIAGLVVKLSFQKSESVFFSKQLFNEISKSYKGFIINEKKRIDFTFLFKDAEKIKILEREKKRYVLSSFHPDGIKAIIFYYISFFQFQLILKEVLANLLNRNNGIIIHASSVMIKKRATLFLGKSGVGKSTAVNLLKKQFIPLADDTLIIKKEKNNFFLYQTPFIEKNFWFKKNNKKIKLGDFFFLKQSLKFYKKRIVDKKIILNKMFNQLITTKKIVNKNANLLMDLINQKNNFYNFYFAKNRKKMVNLCLKNEI